MFKLLERTELKEIKSTGYLYEHESQARLIHIKNDDSNKVFSVTFKTPPCDSTGVFHILEHCVLNGSQKYDCKDPFNELAKGSLNTYINASTYPDRTMYPIASYNDKDFLNLMRVYLDAVYAPLILERKGIFLQEGFRRDIEAGNVKNNGIVYNEMKGTFSNPDRIINDYITGLLFPDTCYKYSSGGHPSEIPDITYEGLLNAYETFYTPSNSYIYLYGDMDFDECVKEIEPYLNKPPKQKPEITAQESFNCPITAETKYQILKTENPAGKNYLVSAYAINIATNPKLKEAFKILDYMLFDNPAAPLKEELKHLGEEISSSLNPGTFQPKYMIVVKNSNADIEKLKSAVYNKLSGLVRDGIDKKLIQSAINKFEFNYREEDYGRWPKGLLYGIDIIPGWIYGAPPFESLDKLKIIEEIKNIENYFESLIDKYLLNNPHCCHVTFTAGYEPLYEERELKNPSEEQIEDIKNDMKSLAEYQSKEDTAEQLAKIPHISVLDIPKEVEHDTAEIFDGMLITNIKANDVIYTNYIFDASHIEAEDMGYLAVLCHCFGKMDTKKYKYTELAYELDINLGGWNISFEARPAPKLVVKIKALKNNMKKAQALVLEIIKNTVFDDAERLMFLIKELKSAKEQSMVTEGHLFAIYRALSYTGCEYNYHNYVYGAEAFFFLKKLTECLPGNIDAVKNNITKIINTLFVQQNLFISTTEDCGHKNFETELPDTAAAEKYKMPEAAFKKEAFITRSKVQYVVKSANYKKHLNYNGELAVLTTALNGGHLMSEIRIKGGAYGCGSLIDREGYLYMYSYRDPNIIETLRAYDEAGASLKTLTNNEIDKYIIGTINNYDRPLTPRGKHEKALGLYLCGITQDKRQKERDEILGATSEKLRRYADMLSETMREDNICVFGSDDKINEYKNIFQNIYIL